MWHGFNVFLVLVQSVNAILEDEMVVVFKDRSRVIASLVCVLTLASNLVTWAVFFHMRY